MIYAQNAVADIFWRGETNSTLAELLATHCLIFSHCNFVLGKDLVSSALCFCYWRIRSSLFIFFVITAQAFSAFSFFIF